MLQYLLDHDVSGARLRFQVRDDRSRELRFVKYIRARNDVGFRCIFRPPTQDRESLDRLAKELSERGITNNRVKSHGGLDELVVECEHDIGMAHMILRLVFERVLGTRVEGHCVAYFDNVLISNSPRLTGVDAPRT